ncbi:hypothetical protein O6P43_028985 [Quillaja saponaria]|uniref:Uncharacterized protein n=1 Tax=Quillaja saponaria TaxID=32244 RepID=A0AAD7KZ87_QUISA|nr:hypothetical protein O6P43_028985 [Quillaja saponaria]
MYLPESELVFAIVDLDAISGGNKEWVWGIRIWAASREQLQTFVVWVLLLRRRLKLSSMLCREDPSPSATTLPLDSSLPLPLCPG